MPKWVREALDYLNVMIENKTGVSNCARCGEIHTELYWYSLDNPSWNAPEGATPCIIVGYAMCPTTEQPILSVAWEDSESTV